jgi:nicotinamide mononucleotide adenylyltransferase
MKVLLLTFALLATIYLSTSSPIAKRATKDELVKAADDLLTQAKAEVEKLKTAMKDREAAHIALEEHMIHRLAEEIKNAETEGPHIKMLETRLQEAENHLKEELKKVEGSSTGARLRRATKDELVKAADDLLTQAKAAVEKLKTAMKDREAAHIEMEERVIHRLAEEIKNAETEGEHIKMLETRLQEAENRLTEELKRVEGSSTGATKDELVKAANDLLTQAQDEVEKLKTAKKDHEAAHIAMEEHMIRRLADEIKNAETEGEHIKMLETRLQAAENRLKEELKKVEGSSTGARLRRATKDELVKAADDLVTKAKAEVEKLRADGKRLQAIHIEFEEKQIAHLAEEIKAAENENAHIKMLEERLQHAETRLTEELKRLDAGSA